MKLAEVIATVIELSDVVKQEVEARQAEKPLGTFYDPLRACRGPTEAENKLRDFLTSQSVATVYTVVLVMYAGRGDWPITDFLEQYEEMKATFDNVPRAVGQMMEKVPLPDYLREGVRLLVEQGIDVDKLME